MIPATERPERDFAALVREWFKLVAAGSWDEAFQRLDLPPSAGPKFTPESEPLNVAYALGALAGLRTGEVFALRWLHVDLAARRIHVRESVKGPLKDEDSRVVPILDRLLPVLADWKLRTGGEGRVIPPLRCDGQKIDKGTPGTYLRLALDELGLAREGLRWYQATRHTFASQWVMNGGSIEKLKEILGHYSVVITERYAHLRPDLFTARDLATIDVSLSASDASPSAIKPENGHEMATSEPVPFRIPLKSRRKDRSRPVSRVLFRRKSGGGEHSSRTRVAARLQRAVPGGLDRDQSCPPLARRDAPLFALAPGGVCRAAPVTRRAVRSYRTVSPLPRAPGRPGAVRRSVLCGTFLRVAPTGR